MMILMSSQRIVNEIPMNRHGMQQERRNGRQADLPITRRRNDLTNCFRGYLLTAEMLLGQHVWEWNRGRHCSQRDKSIGSVCALHKVKCVHVSTYFLKQ